MRNREYTSEELYQGCLEGKQDACEEAARYVHVILCGFKERLCEEEREDLVNETIVYFISRGLEEIEKPDAYKHLLSRKAKCLAIDLLRRKKVMRIQEPLQPDEDDHVPDDYFPPSPCDCENRIFVNQALELCYRIIRSMKADCREILPQYFNYKVSGEGVGNLALKLGKPLGTVATTVHRCLRKLYSHPDMVMLKGDMTADLG